jgi:hypothetical protein
MKANIMVEYTYEEGKNLLAQNLSNANTTLTTIKEDLAYLKEQITTAEVGMITVAYKYYYVCSYC